MRTQKQLQRALRADLLQGVMEILGFEPGELRQLLALKDEIEQLAKGQRSAAEVLAILRLRRVAREMSRFRTMTPSNDP